MYVVRIRGLGGLWLNPSHFKAIQEILYRFISFCFCPLAILLYEGLIH